MPVFIVFVRIKKLEFCQQILLHISDIKYQEKPSSGVNLFYDDGQTDRQTDMTGTVKRNHFEIRSCFHLHTRRLNKRGPLDTASLKQWP